MGWRNSILGVYRHISAPVRLLGGSLLEYLIVGFLYAVATIVLTDFVLLHGSHQLFTGGPGDGTAGFLWLNFAGNSISPLAGHSDLINYPQGVSLGNPTYITYLALWVPLWVLSHIFDPVMALNLVTFFGFWGGAMAMYWLVKRLTGNMFAAFFGGYAVAFAPYQVIKATSHLAYIFSGNFVLILASFIGFWRKQTWRRAVLLALAIALAYYTDGYYLLIASVFISTLVLGGVIYDVLDKRKAAWTPLVKRAKFLILAGGVLGVLCAPIAYTQLTYGSEVNSKLAQARGDMGWEIAFYSAMPMDFFVPPLYHPVFSESKMFNEIQDIKNARSNAAESTLYLGYSVLTFVAIGLAFALAYFFARNKSQTLHRLPSAIRRQFLFVGCVVLVSSSIMIAFMLPPHNMVHGHNIPMLSEIFIRFHINLWRVLARFFIPLHVVIELFASLTLAIVLSKITWKRVFWKFNASQLLQLVVVILLLAFMTFEYATRFNRPAFDFERLPQAYNWLEHQKDIKTIAEFPLVARPFEYSYIAVTGQMVHKKNLVNMHLSTQLPGDRNALVSIANPEAIDFAAARGAQAAITHGQPCSLHYPWLKLIYNGENDRKDPWGFAPVCIYRLNAVTRDKLFANLKTGFSDVPILEPGNKYTNAMFGNYAEIQAMNEKDQFIPKREKALFTAELVQGQDKTPFTGTWRILQDDRLIVSGVMTDSQPVAIHAAIDASKPVQVRVMDATGNPPQTYQVALTNITITEQ